jgi:LPS sulfotransferase NodH
MKKIADLFQDFHKVISGEIDVVCEKPTLILAISARTGSTQLCSVLESMKAFGSPDEIFNPRGVIQQHIKNDGTVSFVEYIKKLSNTDSPFFSLKTSWLDFAPISQVYERIFPDASFVFLDRFDIVAQAFSLNKAIETGKWHSNINSPNDKKNFSYDELDVDRIRSLMMNLMHEKLMWEKFFYINKLAVHHVYYEIIKDDWIAAARMIAEKFGINNKNVSGGNFVKLADESDEQLITQFKKAHGYTWVTA